MGIKTALAPAVVVLVAGCAGVHVEDKASHDLGYLSGVLALGQRAHEGRPAPKSDAQKTKLCLVLKDRALEDGALEPGEGTFELDFMLGCQEAMHRH